MDKNLTNKIDKLLKKEAYKVMKSEEPVLKKLDKMNQIINIIKVVENYDELEPTLKKFFNEKHNKNKWDRGG